MANEKPKTFNNPRSGALEEYMKTSTGRDNPPTFRGRGYFERLAQGGYFNRCTSIVAVLPRNGEGIKRYTVVGKYGREKLEEYVQPYWCPDSPEPKPEDRSIDVSFIINRKTIWTVRGFNSRPSPRRKSN